MTLDEFFEGYGGSRPIFDALHAAIVAIGPVEVRATTSQVAFRRSRPFAWAWIPDRYLHGDHAPLVLSVALTHREESPRWMQVVEPVPGRFMHHVELHSRAEIDDEVVRWLRMAWEQAA